MRTVCFTTWLTVQVNQLISTGTFRIDSTKSLASLDDCENALTVPGQKELFLSFMRSALKWDPEERSTARELLEHPWLRAD